MTDRAAHRIVRVTIVGVDGARPAGTAYVHPTRCCDNCAHDGAKDPEWVAAELGRCMNLCEEADDEPWSQWCPEHQTPGEFRAGIHRSDRPALVGL